MLDQKQESYKYVLPLENKKRTFPLMITFYNVTLKIETSSAKTFVESILKTWNVNDVIVMFILFIFG